MSKKEHDSPSSIFGSTGILAVIIIIVAIIAVVALIVATGNAGGSAAADKLTAVAPNECGRTVISYVNTNLAAPNSTATLVSVSEKDGMYLIAARYQEQDLTFYATKTCNNIFSGIRDMKATPTPTSSPGDIPSPMATRAPVKAVRPSVELFVMSFCPYGVQAESAMGPVADLLGTKADIKVRFIATVNGENIESVNSLHGLTEAKEDVRQLCITKKYPDKYWDYLDLFNAQCYPVYKNATQYESCWNTVATSLGITGIETCASGSEGIALLKADETITKSLKVTGSPTLFINGQRYSGQRTAEAYKQAICAGFESAPTECSVNLSAQAAPASQGNC